MSLNLAYEIARSGLSANAAAASVVSRNIANVDNPDASRKSATIVGNTNGGVRIDGIAIAVDAALFESTIETTASYNQLRSVADALEQLEIIVNDPELGQSPSALLGELQSALQAAAAAPHDDRVARTAIAAAAALASGMNRSANVVEGVRADADRRLAESVDRLGNLLAEFETVNNAVVSGEAFGRDNTGSIDARNRLLREISELINVRATTRANNDVVLFAANGATLFEEVPRRISIDPIAALAPGQPGGALRIDGVPAFAAGAGALGGGLGGLLQVRDTVAVVLGRQLDEIARGLIVAFAESDQSATPALPDLAGLFTYAGGPGLPPPGIVLDGLAARIVVNANVDPSQGGAPSRLRDGGISMPGDPAYVYNSADVAGFSDRLRALTGSFTKSQDFDPAAGIGATATLFEFAAGSAGWLENQRKTAAGQLQDKQILHERATGAWQGRVGVNLDEELTVLIALERSYQASSRLITSVNAMFEALLNATG